MAWTMRMDSEVAGISALVAADAAAYLSAFNPSIFTIRHFGGQWGSVSDTRGDIYRGLALGAALTLVTGFGGSAVTESWWPLISALAVLLFIGFAYAWALQNPHDGAAT